MAARQVEKPWKALWSHTADIVEQLVNADGAFAALCILEQQCSWAAMTREMDAQWRWLALQPREEILQLAHLVDHNPNMVMQGTGDVITLRFIV